jgi:cell fate regulator YaaT (PSP1 superfamily)
MTASDRGGEPEATLPVEATAEASSGAGEAQAEAPAAVAERSGGRLVNRTVVGVVFAIGDAPHEVDCIGLLLEPGDRVLVETAREPRAGTVATRAQVKAVDPRKLRRVIRRIQDSQVALERSSHQEREAFSFCQDQIRALKLPMKLVRVELGQGGARLTFHFASEERVDFRNLVRELARRFHARIEMRQIGVRDQAKMVGGLGLCGRELCCCSWIHRFAPVSIRMAKDQGLALNPQKVSGVCGRLLCCLNYEEEIYRELRVGLPKVGKRIQTPSGEGRVRDVDVLQGRVRVLLESGLKEFTREDLCTGCPGTCAKHAAGGAAAGTTPVAAKPADDEQAAEIAGESAIEPAVDGASREGGRRSRRGRRRGGEPRSGSEPPASGASAAPGNGGASASTPAGARPPVQAPARATAPASPRPPAPAAPIAARPPAPPLSPPAGPPAAALDDDGEDGDDGPDSDTPVAVEGQAADGEAPRKRRRRRRRRKPRGGEGGPPPAEPGPTTAT